MEQKHPETFLKEAADVIEGTSGGSIKFSAPIQAVLSSLDKETWGSESAGFAITFESSRFCEFKLLQSFCDGLLFGAEAGCASGLLHAAVDPFEKTVYFFTGDEKSIALRLSEKLQISELDARKKELANAVATENYEEAAKLRDAIENMEALKGSAK